MDACQTQVLVAVAYMQGVQTRLVAEHQRVVQEVDFVACSDTPVFHFLMVQEEELFYTSHDPYGGKVELLLLATAATPVRMEMLTVSNSFPKP